jgi:hypothetical protein
MPLALAMSVNVGFILGLTFVPGLWNIVEYMFPAAMVAFLAIGAIAFRELGHFVGARLQSRAASTARPTTHSLRCCPPSHWR